MSENPLQALFHNFEQVSNFVQHHLSNFIGLRLQSSGPSGRGPLFSVSSSSKAPLAKTNNSVQLGDTALEVSIISAGNLKFQRFYWEFCASEHDYVIGSLGF